MVDKNRRKVLMGAGALLAGGAGCLGSGSSDQDGDGVPDEHDYAPGDPSVQSKSDISGDSPTETTEYDERTPTETEEPYTETETEPTTPGPDEPLSMEYLQERSPSVAEAVRSYNNNDHRQIASNVNATMNFRFDYGEQVLRESSGNMMEVYRDAEAEATADRYAVDIDIETDRFGSFADLSQHTAGGKISEESEDELTYLLGEFIQRTVDPDNRPIGGVMAPSRTDRQDAVSDVTYNLRGAKGGELSVHLDGEDLSYAVDASLGTDVDRLVDLAQNLVTVE